MKKEVKPNESLMKYFDILLKEIPKEAREKARKVLKERSTRLVPENSMSKEKFIQQYIVSFLSSHVISEYNDRCMRGTWGTYHHPVEDAFSLAEQAWAELQEITLDKCKEFKIGGK